MSNNEPDLIDINKACGGRMMRLADFESMGEDKKKEWHERIEFEEEIARNHAISVCLHADMANMPDSYRSIDDPDYRDPTLEEVNHVITSFNEIHSLVMISKMLGIHSEQLPTRVINRWRSGEKQMPYCSWRMLLIISGRATQYARIPDFVGEKKWEKLYSPRPSKKG